MQASYTLGAGAQTLRWDYIKDPAVIGGSDAAWVDQVTFVPGSAGVTPTLAGTASDATVGATKGFAAHKEAAARAVSTSIQLAVVVDQVKGGRTLLLLAGPGNRECRILASDDLVRWKEIGVARIGENGLAEFTEPVSASTVPCRFYRAVVP